MKKLLTTLLAVSVVAFATAQSDNNTPPTFEETQPKVEGQGRLAEPPMLPNNRVREQPPAIISNQERSNQTSPEVIAAMKAEVKVHTRGFETKREARAAARKQAKEVKVLIANLKESFNQEIDNAGKALGKEFGTKLSKALKDKVNSDDLPTLIKESLHNPDVQAEINKVYGAKPITASSGNLLTSPLTWIIGILVAVVGFLVIRWLRSR